MLLPESAEFVDDFLGVTVRFPRSDGYELRHRDSVPRDRERLPMRHLIE
jgi:hypothetical protein